MERLAPFNSLSGSAVAVCLLVLLAGCHSQPAAPPAPPTLPTPEQIYARCAPSVFLMRLYDDDRQETGSGRGFLLEGAGRQWWGVTARHVFGEAESARIEMPGGGVGTVELSCENWGRDLAFLQIVFDRDVDLVPLELDPLPHAGFRIYCLGDPRKGDSNLSAGFISELRMIEDVQFLQLTATIVPDSAGTPILNEAGQIAGIATVVPGQEENLAITAGEIADVKEREDWEVRELMTLEK